MHQVSSNFVQTRIMCELKSVTSTDTCRRWAGRGKPVGRRRPREDKVGCEGWCESGAFAVRKNLSLSRLLGPESSVPDLFVVEFVESAAGVSTSRILSPWLAIRCVCSVLKSPANMKACQESAQHGEKAQPSLSCEGDVVVIDTTLS